MDERASPDPAEKARIYWQNLDDGSEGHGDPISRRLAEEWVKELRKDKSSGKIIYRIVEVTP